MRRRRPSHLLMRPMTTVRAGMLMPRARVSVAKTTSISPRVKSTSTSCLRIGQQPGVVEADPLASEGDHGLDLLELPIFGAHPRQDGLDRLVDETNLAFGDQIRSHDREALGECLAIIPAEQKVDRRQHVLGGEGVDDLAGLRFVHLRRAALGASFGEAAAGRLAAQLAAGMGKSRTLAPV